MQVNFFEKELLFGDYLESIEMFFSEGSLGIRSERLLQGLFVFNVDRWERCVCSIFRFVLSANKV